MQLEAKLEPSSLSIDYYDRSIVITGDIYDEKEENKNVFVAKYSQLGALLWIKQFGTEENDYSEGVVIDLYDRSIVIVGHTYGTFLDNVKTGHSDMFIARISSTSEIIWIKQYGVDGWMISYTSLVIDSYDRSIVVNCRVYNESLNNFILIAKFNSTGTLQWTKSYAVDTDSTTKSIALDPYDRSIITTGYTLGELEGNINYGYFDTFVIKTTKDGDIN